MKHIHRLAGVFLLAGALCFSIAPATHAAAGDTLLDGLDTAAGEEGAGFDTEQSDLTVFIARFVNVLLTASGIIFLLMVVYGGFLYLTSGGSEDNVKKAKRLLVSSVIGLIITTSAYAISFYVFEKLLTITGEASSIAF